MKEAGPVSPWGSRPRLVGDHHGALITGHATAGRCRPVRPKRPRSGVAGLCRSLWRCSRRGQPGPTSHRIGSGRRSRRRRRRATTPPSGSATSPARPYSGSSHRLQQQPHRPGEVVRRFGASDTRVGGQGPFGRAHTADVNESPLPTDLSETYSIPCFGYSIDYPAGCLPRHANPSPSSSQPKRLWDQAFPVQRPTVCVYPSTIGQLLSSKASDSPPTTRLRKICSNSTPPLAGQTSGTGKRWSSSTVPPSEFGLPPPKGVKASHLRESAPAPVRPISSSLQPPPARFSTSSFQPGMRCSKASRLSSNKTSLIAQQTMT